MKKPALALMVAGAAVVAGAMFAQLNNGPPETGGPEPGAAGTVASAAFGEYSPEAVSSAPEGEKVVLFFHAQWCATCKLLADDIAANASRIPPGVRILVADFDSETALKQRYGVTMQHTLVQLGPGGSLVGKWHLSRTLDDVISNIS